VKINKYLSDLYFIIFLAIVLFTAINSREKIMSFKIHSTAFEDKGAIPSKYTCEGENISPPIVWDSLPEGTRSLALIVDDPDAPDPAAPKMVFVHWVVYDIPVNVQGFKEGMPAQKNLPGGGTSGINDYHVTGYKGPCPPIGRHRYFFKIYALDAMLNLNPGLKKAELLSAIKGHVLDETVMYGTYQKQ